MKIAVVGWGKVSLLAAIPLGYLGLCWWYAPPWWLTLVSYGVLNKLLISLLEYWMDQAVQDYLNREGGRTHG